jgi:hypothetical protein
MFLASVISGIDARWILLHDDSGVQLPIAEIAADVRSWTFAAGLRIVMTSVRSAEK